MHGTACVVCKHWISFVSHPCRWSTDQIKTLQDGKWWTWLCFNLKRMEEEDRTGFDSLLNLRCVHSTTPYFQSYIYLPTDHLYTPYYISWHTHRYILIFEIFPGRLPSPCTLTSVQVNTRQGCAYKSWNEIIACCFSYVHNIHDIHSSPTLSLQIVVSVFSVQVTFSFSPGESLTLSVSTSAWD